VKSNSASCKYVLWLKKHWVRMPFAYWIALSTAQRGFGTGEQTLQRTNRILHAARHGLKRSTAPLAQNWSADKIVHEVSDILTDPEERGQRNGDRRGTRTGPLLATCTLFPEAIARHLKRVGLLYRHRPEHVERHLLRQRSRKLQRHGARSQRHGQGERLGLVVAAHQSGLRRRPRLRRRDRLVQPELRGRGQNSPGDR
jgi:hypothetical protein